MSIISIILPVALIAGIWYLIVRGGAARRGVRRESAFDYAKTHSIDEVLAKYGTVPQPPQGSQTPQDGPKRPPLPLTSRLILGPELHESGVPKTNPFGEDIESPDSREIPPAFRGTWVREAGPSVSRKSEVIIEADQFTRIEGIGMQPVVAVRLISETEIAIVSQSIENGKWLYALNYFGLLEGGKVLTDLESMDMQWARA